MAATTGMTAQRRNQALVAGGLTIAAGLAAAPLANLGMKGLAVVVAAAVIVAGLFAFRDRALWLMFLTVAGLQFMLHKTFGPIDGAISSGAPALYVTSLDLFVVLLYAHWWWEGGLVRDVRRAYRPLLLLPLLPIAGSLLSLPAAENVGDAFAEILRMAWMAALFLYLAVRVTTRRDVIAVLAGLAAVALVQGVIVVLQWLTHGHLGLSFLGEDPGLYVRNLNEGVLRRPAGTAIHPDILAALTGPIGLVALALALNLKDTRARLACLAVAAAAFVPLVLSETRGAIAATGIAGLLLVGIALAAGRLRWSFVLVPLPFLGLAVWYFWPLIQRKVIDNFQTTQFQQEITARLQLNDVAFRMVHEHPIAGVGLNNFMAVFEQYNPYGVLYPGYPAHDLYLIVFAETGALGLLALLAVLAGVLLLGLRLARAGDRLLSGLGLGVAAMVLFYLLEELFSFSLRADGPLALFWMLGGLAAGCAQTLPHRVSNAPEAPRRAN
ncbi:MAG TPA: O-antigen ligase family protein [Candidatus Acidoferrales bacterium]|nr:O-antigen ligase family protein [Candidatus Acidoferrales bacterium]